MGKYLDLARRQQLLDLLMPHGRIVAKLLGWRGGTFDFVEDSSNWAEAVRRAHAFYEVAGEV